MPTYDYECGDCRYQFEAFQSMTADPLEECPQCGGKIRRLISGGTGIIFKGSGFYVTDNKSTSKNAASKGNDNKDESGKGKESSGGEAKESSSGTKSATAEKSTAAKKEKVSAS